MSPIDIFQLLKEIYYCDTPGHIQYTRNMFTGASNSDLAIILIDARKVFFNNQKDIFISLVFRDQANNSSNK